MANAFGASTALVALGEMGDKTQLLALVLVSRFRRPWLIALGILLATLANHALAGAAGAWVRTVVPLEWLRWGGGALFIAMAVWMLVPDQLDEGAASGAGASSASVLWLTVSAFFIAEMGDKTQIATVMLASQFDSLLAVVAGSTLGLMLANAPVLWLGQRFADRLPVRVIHLVAAALFAVLGVAIWLRWLG